jgi:hypothetical protein
MGFLEWSNGAMATPTLMLLLIDYNVIIRVRLIVVPQLVPPFPIADVVGFELKFFKGLFANHFFKLIII